VSIWDDEPHDKALGFHWKAKNEEWYDSLILPPAKTKSLERARASILLDAIVEAYGEDRSISYSRNKNFYSGKKRYQGNDYSYANVPYAVDEFTDLGLLDHNKMEPRSNNQFQSSFKASETLRLETLPPSLAYQPNESVLLKNRSKSLFDFQDTQKTVLMRKNLRKINDGFQHASIKLISPNVVEKNHLLICKSSNDKNIYLNTQRNSLHRVFNNLSWHEGGRF